MGAGKPWLKYRRIKPAKLCRRQQEVVGTLGNWRPPDPAREEPPAYLEPILTSVGKQGRAATSSDFPGEAGFEILSVNLKDI